MCIYIPPISNTLWVLDSCNACIRFSMYIQPVSNTPYSRRDATLTHTYTYVYMHMFLYLQSKFPT